MFPKYIQDEFLSIPSSSTDENQWNGAWNMLLNYYFPGTERWVVVPQPPRSRTDPADCGVIFKIERDKIPILFVELKASASLSNLSARARADAQMRERFAEFYGASPTIFSGLSAFGTRVCKYSIDKETNIVKPKRITGSSDRLIDVAPLGNWNIDMKTQEGEIRLCRYSLRLKTWVRISVIPLPPYLSLRATAVHM